MFFFWRKDPRIKGREFVLKQIKAELERLIERKEEKEKKRSYLEDNLPNWTIEASKPRDEDKINIYQILIAVGQNDQLELNTTICEKECRISELWEMYIIISDEIADLKAGTFEDSSEDDIDDVTKMVREGRDRSLKQGKGN